MRVLTRVVFPLGAGERALLWCSGSAGRRARLKTTALRQGTIGIRPDVSHC
jgi:hypothetical protein